MDTNNPGSGASDKSSIPLGTGNGGSVKSAYEEAANSTKPAVAPLRSELSNLKSDLDALLSRASTLTDRELSDAQEKLLVKFNSMRFAAKGMAADAKKKVGQGVDATAVYVKDRPMQSVAIAAGVGLLLGLVLRRR